MTDHDVPIGWMWTHENGDLSFTGDPSTKRIWEESMKRKLEPVFRRRPAHPLPMKDAPKNGTWFIAEEGGLKYPCSWQEIERDEGACHEGWYDHVNESFENPEHWWPVEEAVARPIPPIQLIDEEMIDTMVEAMVTQSARYPAVPDGVLVDPIHPFMARCCLKAALQQIPAPKAGAVADAHVYMDEHRRRMNLGELNGRLGHLPTGRHKLYLAPPALRDFMIKIGKIASDFVPSNDAEAPIALAEMRGALEEALVDIEKGNR